MHIQYICSQKYLLKKISLILILAIMAFSQIGYYVVMHQAQLQHKEYIKKLLYKNIDENTLTVIDYTTNNNKIFWEEEGKEFFFKGEMYDLVKTKSIKGKVFFYCINDEKEKELTDNFNSINKKNSGTDKKAKNTFENSISPYILIPLFILYPFNLSISKCPSSIANIKIGNIGAALKPPQIF